MGCRFESVLYLLRKKLTLENYLKTETKLKRKLQNGILRQFLADGFGSTGCAVSHCKVCGTLTVEKVLRGLETGEAVLLVFSTT